jgi:tight adherence protein B
VIAIDNSQSMDPGGALVQARDAAANYIRNAPEGEQIGLVSFAGTARVVQRLTTDRDRLLAALNTIAPSGGSAIWNGIDTASKLVDEAPAGRQGNVLVIAGGPTETATISSAQARGSAVSAKATVYGVGLLGRGLDEGGVRDIVAATGGTYGGQENPAAIGDAVAAVGDQLSSLYVVTYESSLEPGPVDLTLSVDGEQTAVSFVAGGVAEGSAALRAIEPQTPGGIGFFRDNGFIVGLALAAVAVALAIWAIGSLMTADRGSLDTVLEQYTDTGPTSFDDDDDGSVLARTALIQRAVSLTEDFAERRGFLARVEAMLERANLPLRAAEALFFYFAGIVVVVLAVFFLSGGNPLAALVVTGLMALVPPAVVNFLGSRRQKAFVGQLPDTLQLLAGTLRAGYSLMQGVEAVSQEVSEPMGHELRRVVTESRLGRPLEESLQASADRMQSADFQWAVMAIGIQREVGGNLAELLLTVGDTMTQRERLRRDVSALTAEGKISAIVLGLLPVGLGLAMWLMNPDYIAVLFDTTLGNILLGGAILLAGIGFYWMKKVIEIDI